MVMSYLLFQSIFAGYIPMSFRYDGKITQEKKQPRSKTQTNRTRAKTEPNPDQINKGGGREGKEGQGRREPRLPHQTIVQLSGKQWGTRIIRMMNTSVWQN